MNIAPEKVRPDLIEAARDMQARGIEICGAKVKGSNWRCAQPVMRGSEHCWQHTPGKPQLIDAMTDEALRLAAEMFAKGATGQAVADALGLEAAHQAYALKQSRRFPTVVIKEPPAPKVELEIVGLMKTGPDRWTELYGPG